MFRHINNIYYINLQREFFICESIVVLITAWHMPTDQCPHKDTLLHQPPPCHLIMSHTLFLLLANMITTIAGWWSMQGVPTAYTLHHQHMNVICLIIVSHGGCVFSQRQEKLSNLSEDKITENKKEIVRS